MLAFASRFFCNSKAAKQKTKDQFKMNASLKFVEENVEVATRVPALVVSFQIQTSLSKLILPHQLLGEQSFSRSNMQAISRCMSKVLGSIPANTFQLIRKSATFKSQQEKDKTKVLQHKNPSWNNSCYSYIYNWKSFSYLGTSAIERSLCFSQFCNRWF